MKTNLVIGYGEIGKAISTILECQAFDPYLGLKLPVDTTADVIHICFPYSEKFIELVQGYKVFFCAEMVIIHSTVPVGTTREIGDFAVHSPVRGVHPHLEKGIRTFTKYFAGPLSDFAALQFPMLEEKQICDIPEVSELMKLVDTTIYGVNILLQKETKRLCDEYGIDFDAVYTEPNTTYNEGYEKLGMPQFKKYNLKDYPGPIGGHCIMPNVELFDSWMCDLLKERNKNL